MTKLNEVEIWAGDSADDIQFISDLWAIVREDELEKMTRENLPNFIVLRDRTGNTIAKYIVVEE